MTQINTGGNSERRAWAGTKSEDENYENYNLDGTPVEDYDSKKSPTDYKAKGKMKKSFPATRMFLKSCQDSRSICNAARQVEFLNVFVKSFGNMIFMFEKGINEVLENTYREQVMFNKSLNKALQVLSAHSDGLYQISDMVDKEGLMFKALPNEDLQMNKSIPGVTKQQVLSVLIKGVEAGRLEPLDVTNFESTGSLTPNAQRVLGLQK